MTATAKTAVKDINSYGDTRGTKLYWRDPKDQVSNALKPSKSALSKTGKTPNVNDKWRTKAIDLYDPSMEPDKEGKEHPPTKELPKKDTKNVKFAKELESSEPVKKTKETVKTPRPKGYKYDFFSESPREEKRKSEEPNPSKPQAVEKPTEAKPTPKGDVIKREKSEPMLHPKAIIQQQPKEENVVKPTPTQEKILKTTAIQREYSDIPIRGNKQPLEPRYRENGRRHSYSTLHAKTDADPEPEKPRQIEREPSPIPLKVAKKPIEPKFRERNKNGHADMHAKINNDPEIVENPMVKEPSHIDLKITKKPVEPKFRERNKNGHADMHAKINNDPEIVEIPMVKEPSHIDLKITKKPVEPKFRERNRNGNNSDMSAKVEKDPDPMVEREGKVQREPSPIPLKVTRKPTEPKFRERNRNGHADMHAKLSNDPEVTETPGVKEPSIIDLKPLKKPTEPKFRERNQNSHNNMHTKFDKDPVITEKVEKPISIAKEPSLIMLKLNKPPVEPKFRERNRSDHSHFHGKEEIDPDDIESPILPPKKQDFPAKFREKGGNSGKNTFHPREDNFSEEPKPTQPEPKEEIWSKPAPPAHKFRESNRGGNHADMHLKEEVDQIEPAEKPKPKGVERAISPIPKPKSAAQPGLPKISVKPTTPPKRREIDQSDPDHGEFYKWLFNGNTDMNKAKKLLFQPGQNA